MTTTLTPYVFMDNVTTSGTYGPYSIDYRYDEDKLRSISGTRVDTNDAIQILLETVAGDVTVTATATVFTSANGTHNSAVLQGPFTRVKIVKTGSSGAATFVGLL